MHVNKNSNLQIDLKFFGFLGQQRGQVLVHVLNQFSNFSTLFLVPFKHVKFQSIGKYSRPGLEVALVLLKFLV